MAGARWIQPAAGDQEREIPNRANPTFSHGMATPKSSPGNQGSRAPNHGDHIERYKDIGMDVHMNNMERALILAAKKGHELREPKLLMTGNTLNWVRERLDRAPANKDWQFYFSNAKVYHIESSSSSHASSSSVLSFNRWRAASSTNLSSAILVSKSSIPSRTRSKANTSPKISMSGEDNVARGALRLGVVPIPEEHQNLVNHSKVLRVGEESEPRRRSGSSIKSSEKDHDEKTLDKTKMEETRREAPEGRSSSKSQTGKPRTTYKGGSLTKEMITVVLKW
ncbi:hypothetical protein RND71_002237 [Anisodus tanguticus]|uniref:Uncharacterized protein n=1 Tax=Anisodus tanguticus TaxID=243964 RepID=A0AAE1T2M8_9SOLA|nr:hypothetical protein RND71_002237 [Anisodus tanguticus]